MANTASDDWRFEDSLAMKRDAIGDWRTLKDVDPTNAISWNNFANARLGAAMALRNLGRWREAIVLASENRDVEPFALSRGLPSPILLYTHGTVAFMAGELGDVNRAREHLKHLDRFAAVLRQRLNSGSFEDKLFNAEVAVYRHEIASAMADEALMREVSIGLRDQLERLQPSDGGQARAQAFFLNRLHRSLGQFALVRGDAAEAVAQMRLCLVQREKLPRHTAGDRQQAAEEASLYAVALARSGRVVEAREVIGPALRDLQEAERRNVDDNVQRAALAQALYASALADPTQAGPKLSQARALIDGLHPDLRSTRTQRWWSERIAEAQRR
jgi:hypothetical protein